ncbi:MAG: MarR family transcriptional regulator [Clostridia bacterium]|nr:MarR family transcriptional regulator [Clostridia bacterium]
MSYERLRLDRQLCFPLYAASRAVVRRYEPHLKALSLTYTQYITLLCLWEQDALSVKELSERLYLDSGTLSPLLATLERKGIVLRARSKDDERVVTVSLTEAGRALEEKAKDIPLAVGSCLAVDREDAAELYRILYRLLER